MQKSQPPPFYCHLPFFEFPPLLIENFQPPPQDINDRKSSPPFKKGGAGTVEIVVWNLQIVNTSKIKVLKNKPVPQLS